MVKHNVNFFMADFDIHCMIDIMHSVSVFSRQNYFAVIFESQNVRDMYI